MRRGERGEEEESWTEKIKNFFGIGPKGYKRSDERIREDVSDRLTDDPRIDASEIMVTVADCVVTLDGFVPSRFMKRLSEDVTESISGVRDVDNKLRVRREEAGVRPGEGSHMISEGKASEQTRHQPQPASRNQ